VTERTKILLDESEIPTQWYNVMPDLPAPMPPPLHPGTGQPVGPEDLAPLFPMELIRQEVTADPYVPIPAEVLDVYRLWRPTPLYRARRLEKALNTPARIYYKYEGVSPAGSHKPNTTRPRAPSGSPPRPAPGSGAARCPSPARSTASTARSGWSGPLTTRSRTGAR
jgi:tryptophan synthase beta chain